MFADDRRRTMPATIDGALPGDILRGAPFRWRSLVRARYTIAIRPAPPRPVVGLHGDLVVDLLTPRMQWKKDCCDNNEYANE